METEIPPDHEQSAALIESLAYLWKRKYWFLAGTFCFGILGFVYGLVATPVYKSDALIAPKEVSDKMGGAAGLLSQFGGGLGSMVASQIGFGNNSLERMEVLLKGRDLNEALIREHALLPVLYPKKWDVSKGTWKPDVDTSVLIREGVELLRTGILDVTIDSKKNMLIIETGFRDSLMAANLIEYYIDGLNRKMHEDVVTSSETNRKFLEDQLATTLDPLLREKLQQMVSVEIEKSMLVSSNSFDVLEKPAVPLFREKPKRKMILLFSLVVGGFISFLGILFAKGIAEAKSNIRLFSVRPKESPITSAR